MRRKVSSRGPRDTVWNERGFLYEVKLNVFRRVIKAHPWSMDVRHIERTVASDTVRPPSERKMRTGDLWIVSHSLVRLTRRNRVPLVTPMLNHERLCCSKSPCIIGPTPCSVRHNAAQEIVWRPSKIARDASGCRALEQDHAVCIPANSDHISPHSVGSCLARDPKPVEGWIHGTKSVVVIWLDHCCRRTIPGGPKICWAHRVGPTAG